MSISKATPREGVGMTSLRTRRRLISRLRDQGILDERVLAVMEQTPRHLFIDQALAHKAYEDTALPIGLNQTISQPYIVALMTQLALDSDTPVRRVLEVGTGCGYQTAVLSQLVNWVFSIERIASLQARAKSLLPELGYRNVSYLNGDGFAGWESNKPFDAIVVTAAPTNVPSALLDQLAVGGRMVIPVGGSELQNLRIVTRTATDFVEQTREAVKFVPMLNGRR
ncbi:MAG: protein-L-isoaspartate(D-aspartate) O-methyltransferase [Pseudomonadota bacterium]